MFTAIMRVQWKWSWLPILMCATIAFTTPLLSIQGTANHAGINAARGRLSAAERILETMERWSLMYSLTALVLGLLVATAAWRADHRGKHIYALTLPIERWRLVLFRFASGSLFMLIPAAALLCAGLLGAAFMELPAGLHPYPVALSIRFLLASLVAYSLFFAISAGTQRTALWVLAPIVLIFLAQLLFEAAGMRVELFEPILNAILAWPGVFHIFTGRWLLVDV